MSSWNEHVIYQQFIFYFIDIRFDGVLLGPDEIVETGLFGHCLFVGLPSVGCPGVCQVSW